MMMPRRREEGRGGPARSRRRAGPDGDRHRSRPKPGRAHDQRQRAARRQARPAGRDCRVGRRVMRVLVDAGKLGSRRPGARRGRPLGPGAAGRAARRPGRRRPGPTPRSPRRITSARIALKDRGFVSKAEIDSKRATRDAAYRAGPGGPGAARRDPRARSAGSTCTAPASGLILARNVEVGQIVSPASGALFRLAEGGQMEMRAQLSQQDLGLGPCRNAGQVTPVGSDRSFSGHGLAGLPGDRPAVAPRRSARSRSL